MKKVIFLLLIFIFSVTVVSAQDKSAHCLTGAFLTDNPTQDDILSFKRTYGKNPYLVMLFVEWDNFADLKSLKSIYAQNCVAVITWEPWRAQTKEGIDYAGLLAGEYDSYIRDFALRLKKIKKTVFLRFAHEPNGNWYPWSGVKLGKDKYIAVYRYVYDIFKKARAVNVRWVFAVNWEDVPKENNNFALYYPGDDYVDYAGIDGYNWANTQSWSKWMSFSEIFSACYQEITGKIKKPLLISEFGSASGSGDKALWIEGALARMKTMRRVYGFILFNVDKEADWRFLEGSKEANSLKSGLRDGHFRDKENW